jgi:glucose/mannose-6-phosphate isomerase
MLDDLKYIHEKDQSDALGIAAKQAGQLRTEFAIERQPQFSNVYNIVHAGMGGSALPAELVKVWPVLPEPFEIVHQYNIPAYVDEDTLFIADSYSGNTEETISALEQALAKKAQVVVIAKGGKLEEIASTRNLPFIKLPDVAQPRYSVLANYKAVLTVLAAAGVVKGEEVFATINQAADFLEKSVQAWVPTVPTKDNPAKQLAQELLGKSVVIYGGPLTYAAAYKWKISFNENAKQVAWVNQLPEFNHNEFIGWSEQPVNKPYAVVDLRSNLEHERVQKRFEVTERLLSGLRPEPHVVRPEGQTSLEQLVWAVAYGDFVSLYLALLNGLNPAPVDLVERLKKALDE